MTPKSFETNLNFTLDVLILTKKYIYLLELPSLANDPVDINSITLTMPISVSTQFPVNCVITTYKNNICAHVRYVVYYDSVGI